MRKLLVSMLITYGWRWLTRSQNKQAARAANSNRRTSATGQSRARKAASGR